MLGAFAFAGAGGTNNLVQSNWIRDKGFGMGRYAPRIVSPVTGEEEAAPATGVTFRPTEENLRRWDRWWSVANKEQFFTFFVLGTLTIVIFSLVAYSTVFGQDIGEDLDFIQGEGNALKDGVGSWFGTLFWAIGALSLFAASIGITDYVSRLVADVLKVGYLRDSRRWSESRIYFAVVWGIVVFGTLVLLAGFDQPLVLTVLAASLSGVVMFVYSGLLIALNRRFLPQPIKLRGVRLGALVWAFGFFGVFSVIYGVEQFKQLF
jgi:Mn2+/Fe2+ NRAMP family transporter